MMRRMGHALLMAVLLVLTLGLAAPAQAGPAKDVPIKGTLTGTETIYPAGYPDGGTWAGDPHGDGSFLDGFYLNSADTFAVDGVTYYCAEPAQDLVVSKQIGDFSHLGKTTRDAAYCEIYAPEYRTVGASTDPDAVPSGDFGTFVLTAANGDTLDIFVTGTIEDADIESVPAVFGGYFDIVGGTGRFAGAEGSMTESGTGTQWYPDGFVDLWYGIGDAEDVNTPWTRDITLIYTGTISYDASNRAAM